MSDAPAHRPNPYVGPRAFGPGERIFGRDRDIQRLLDLLIAERVVALYSPSGAGKTSLLQAGLIPRLVEHDFRVLPIVRVSLEPRTSELQRVPADARAAANRYVLSALLALEEERAEAQRVPLQDLFGLDLAAYLERRRTGSDGDAEWVLVFDQFEELLTFNPTDVAAKEEFVGQVGAALRDRRYWALFAFREEYLAGLDPYVRRIPTRLHTKFRLDLLGTDAAAEAIQRPAEDAGVSFADAAARRLVENLSRVRVPQVDGGVAEAHGQFIEPVQLQVVCLRLWERMPAGAREIVEGDLEQVGDVDEALAGYYDASVRDSARVSRVSERSIRDWIEQELVGPHGVRQQVLEEPGQSAGLPNEPIGMLVDAHLLRAESRRGFTWYELAHDRLVEPIRKANGAWRLANLSPLQHRALAWHTEGQPGDKLFTGDALRQAEEWASAQPTGTLTDIEQTFLARSRDARISATRERRRSRMIAVLAALTVAGGVLVIALLLVAQSERLATEHERATAAQQAHIAQSRQYATDAIGQLTVDPETSLLLGIAAAREAPTDQAAEALRQALAASHLDTVMRGHAEGLSRVAFSPDGRLLATASADNTARVWNADLGTLVMELSGHVERVHDVRFSPDGRSLATASWDGTGRIWDLQSGAWTELRGHSGPLWAVAFSPTGGLVVTAGDRVPRVWEVGTGRQMAVLDGHSDNVTAVAFSADGQRIVTGSLDHTARIWEASTGRLDATLTGHGDRVVAVEFSGDGQKVLTASWDHTARVWDAHSGSPIAELAGHREGVTSAALSPNGLLVVTASTDRTAQIWAADTGRPVSMLRGHQDAILWVAFAADGQRVVTASADRTARVWNVNSGQMLLELRGHTSFVEEAVFSPDGSRVASASTDGTARLWSASPEFRESPLREFAHSPGNGPVLAAAFDRRGERAVTAGWDKLVRIWEVDSGQALATLAGQSAGIDAVAFSGDGLWLATGGWDGSLLVWRTRPETAERPWETKATGPFRELKGHSAAVRSVAWDPSGRRVASGSADGTARVWNIFNGDTLAVLPADSAAVLAVAFGMDGARVLTAASDGQVAVWETTSGRLVNSFTVPEQRIESAAFSVDGTWLVTASGGGAIRLWKVEAGQMVAELPGVRGPVAALTCSADCRFVAASVAPLDPTDTDAGTLVWDSVNRRLVGNVAGATGLLTGVAVNPTGSLVMTTSGVGTARVASWLMFAPVDELQTLALARGSHDPSAQERAQRYLRAAPAS